MKLSWGFILSSFYCSASAASSSKDGHVFIWDPTTKAAARSQAVNSETARLILAQRLGLSQFHSIKDVNEETIGQINAYGGNQQRLFGGDRNRNNAHALIWIDDVENAAEMIQDASEYSADFTISSPPSAAANQRLIQDLVLQAEALPKKADPKGLTYTAGSVIGDYLNHLKRVNTYNDYLTIMHADKSDDLSPPSDCGLWCSISRLLQETKGLQNKGFSLTVVLMPPTSSHSKRSAYPYGAYELPSSIEARREKSEALLSPSAAQPSAAAQNVSPQDLENFPKIMESETEPVLGILPSCFTSRKACETQTRNCTGHGGCDLLHSGDSGKDSARRSDCYGCRCKATVVEVGNGKGKKTTYWGGPACQKKDISVPFWLFAGTGVIIAFLISSGIGLLYSIGNEELPSVIGAGVSGPVRK